MEQFEITIKNEKVRSYQVIALLLVLLNLAVFIFLLLAAVSFQQAAWATLLSGLYLIYLIYTSKKNHNRFSVDWFAFLVVAGGWLILGRYWMAVICIIMGVLYHLSMKKLQICFTDEVIKKMNFPRKEYPWKLLENVMVRDNILTLDFKNNRLLQAEIESGINEVYFNNFAKQHLSQATINEEKQP
jgi:hypothetical protein